MTPLQHLLGGLALCAAAVAVPAGDGYTHRTLASFDKGEHGPRMPSASLLAHPDGHLYGTSYAGGKHQAGTIFRVAPDGRVTVLHHFSGPDGKHPQLAALLLARDGHLVGTTVEGGAYGHGTAFKMNPDGQLKLLHAFGRGNEGRSPAGALVEGADGQFYGVTTYAKGDTVVAHGTVFRMSAHGKVTTLHEFTPDCLLGCRPTGLVDGGDGHLYGTTLAGGPRDMGTVYRLSLAGELVQVHAFDPATEGAWPRAALTRDADGELYGVTSTLGPHGHGTVFRVSRDGAIGVLTVLTERRGHPVPSPLLAASDGGLYLATLDGGGHGQGAVVRVDKGGGDEIVHSFRLGQQAHPWAGGLVQAGDGALVGTTQFGLRKRGRFGTVYRISLPPAREGG